MPLQSHCMVQYDDVTSYLIGGYNIITKEPKNFLFKFDWKTQTWTQKASMIEASRCGNQFKALQVTKLLLNNLETFVRLMVYETKLNVHIAQQEVNFIKYVTV